MTEKPDHVATVRECWGHPVPDWVQALALACRESSQVKVAKRLKVSGSVVSQTLRKSYRGDLQKVEQRVRGALMGLLVDCPELGAMPANECQDWQKAARRQINTNAMRVQMLRACRRCPKYTGEFDDQGA